MPSHLPTRSLEIFCTGGCIWTTFITKPFWSETSWGFYSFAFFLLKFSFTIFFSKSPRVELNVGRQRLTIAHCCLISWVLTCHNLYAIWNKLFLIFFIRVRMLQICIINVQSLSTLNIHSRLMTYLAKIKLSICCITAQFLKEIQVEAVLKSFLEI